MNYTVPSTAAGSSLQLEYWSSDELASQPASWWQGVLGVAGFANPPSLDRARIPVAASLIPALSGGDVCEVWRVADPDIHLASGAAQARVHYRYCDDLLFGTLSLSERTIDAGSESGALLRATEIAYQEVFDVQSETGHPHLIRIWNYLPQINAQSDGDERYRYFNSARQTAFLKSGRAIMGTVPAACALGSPAGSPLCIYFLAARRPPKMIENPRQTSAYHYPPKFGRHSPIFSRACLWGESSSSKLFVSGTASIVGHETIHRGDVIAQTRETLVNIGALLGEANRVVGSTRYSLDALQLKVYVRRPADLPAIKATLSSRTAASAIYLKADICREDLLVEIEAVG